jgi:hypothetical protein
MLATLIGIALLLPAHSPALADEAESDCFGIDFDVEHPITIAKIIADKPRTFFIKNVSDNAACPADTDACLQSAYLVPGDLVLVGKSHSAGGNAYTCVAYQSATDRKQRWTDGWLPSAAMTPVMPAPALLRSDWIGDWVHAGAEIVIKSGKKETVTIHGEAIYPAAQDVHNGVIDAEAKPSPGLLTFADDGSEPFDKASSDDGLCLVRMQRVEALLVVEDNNQCGGVMVTFTGFYRKK